MADLIGYVAGIGPVNDSVMAGANTPAQFRGPHTGATDGESVQTASNNMAEIYNRLLLANIAMVQAAGLEHDPDNWAQNVEAVRLIAQGAAGGGMIVGESRAFNFNQPPPKWLVENGNAVNRVTFAALFQAIGTTFGAGDGSTTFNLPDSMGRAAIGVGHGIGQTNRLLGEKTGAETHILSLGEMPRHNHANSNFDRLLSFTGNGTATSYDNASAANEPNVSSSAIISSDGGDQAHNNMQPSIVKLICIYAGV